MRGFQPAAVEQQFADGGMAGLFKRAIGLKPNPYESATPEELARMQQARQEQQASPPPPEPPAQPKKAISQYSGMSALKRREKEAGLKDGGRVRPRGFVSGPGTPTSDSIPARLSDGEYVLPADTVQAVGVGKLDALRDATHTPARGFSAKKDGEFFLAGGGAASLVSEEERLRRQNRPSADPFDAMVSNTGGLQQRAVASEQDATQARADAQARKETVAAGQANPSFMDVLTARTGQFGEPTDAQMAAGITAAPAAPANQASVNGAPAGTNTMGAPSLVSAEETQRRARAIRGEGQPPSGEVAQTQPGRQIMPGVYTHGRGQYSDNPAGMGFSPGFTGQPSAQNMAAADALAARSQQESRARIAAQAQQQQPQGFAAPVVRSSLNDWQIRNNLRNARISAGSSMSDLWNRRFGSKAQRNAISPEMAEFMALAKADAEAQGGQAAADVAAMKENATTTRTGMQETGANQRSADRLASDAQRFALDAQAKGFDIRNAQRREGILQRYDAAKTDEERAALVTQFPDVFGKQDSNWKLQVTPATKNMDGSTSEGSVIRYNDRTGQVERVNLDGQQQSAPADKAQRKVGVTYMMPNGQLGRWTEKGWLPVA